MDPILDQRHLSRFRLSSGAIGILVGVLGALVLVGWRWDIQVLKGVFPAIGTTMKPNTALGFVLTGLSLALLHRKPGGWARKVSPILAIAAALIGALTLCEYGSGWNLHIDEFLFRETAVSSVSMPGRMSPATAAAFFLSGAALVLIDREKPIGFRFSQFLALLVGVIAFLALAGYLYGASSLYGAGNYTQIAIHTAAAFLALALGVLFARPETGWMRVVSSTSSAGGVFRRMAPAILLIPMIMGWLRLRGQQAGLFQTEFGIALLVLGSTAALLCLLWIASDHLFHIDMKRREILQALEASEEDLGITLQSIGDAVIATDTAGNVVRMNPVAERLTGWEFAEALGRPLKEVFRILSEETKEPSEDPVTKVLREGVVVGLANHTLLLSREGKEIPLSDSGAPIRGRDHKIRGVVLVFRDMSEERQAQDALRQSESNFRKMLDSMLEGCQILDFDWRYLYINDAAQTHNRRPREELLGRTMMESWPGITTTTVFSLERQCMEQRSTHQLDNEFAFPDGSPGWFRLIIQPVPEGIAIYSQDITESKLAEAEILKLNADLENKVSARTVELERANLALVNREEEIRSVVDHMVDCVITIDRYGLIRSANSAVERVFGYGVDEVIGKNVSILMPEPDHSAHDGYLDRYCRTGQARIIGIGREVEGLHKNGDRIALDLAISEYSIQGQRFFTGILRDIRERVRIMEDLRLARTEAEQANLAKSAFLAAMSHEIRTPMNGVIGMIDVLHQTSLKGYQVEMVDLIRESAYALLGIIEDILDFSKIEAGKLEIEKEPMLLAEVLERSCGVMDRLAEKKGVEFTLFVDPAIPDVVEGDALRLRQVIINLSNNAIKFSSGSEHPGQVAVRACLARSSNDRIWVAFQVVDNGIGMEEATRVGLFTPFTQADASTTRRFGGTGLGLAISHQLVELMGGHIEVRSQPGQGSIFEVELPFTPLPNPPHPSEESSVVDGLPCLIVGGPEGQAEDMAVYLRAAGAVVERATDMVGATELIRSISPGLWVWVLDLGREPPALDALRAAMAERSDLESRLLVIGRGMHTRRRRPRVEDANLVSIDGNLLTRRTILKAVALAAGRIPEEPESLLPDKGPATGPPTRPEAIRQGRLILVAEDNETNQKVILQQLALLGYAADVVGDGKEALLRWQTGEYALLLTDLHMPDMDGYELTAAIRAEELDAQRIPIVALTANALKGEAERCQAVGMDDYLNKPTPLADLKAVLEQWLSVSAPITVVPPGQIPDSSGKVPVDVRVLEALVGDDPAVIREFLSVFRQSAAKVAAELEIACENGHPAHAAGLAHKLKSSARSVGAIALGELCAELEHVGKAGAVDELKAIWPRMKAEMAAVNEYLMSL